MIKNKKLHIKKIILAIIFLIITIIAGIKPIFAISGSGTADWKGNQYDTFFKTTESISYNRGILARKLTNQNTKEIITVFCANHTEDFVPNTTYSGNYYIPTDGKVIKACKIAYFGWYKKYGSLFFEMEEFQKSENYTQRQDYAFTQQYIWEVLGQSSAIFIDTNIQKNYETFKSNINKELEEIEKKPSFNNETINLEAGEEKILTDENGILKDYCSIDKTINDVRVIHTKGENTLKIIVSENCKVNEINISEQIMKSWGMIKEETKKNNTAIYFEFKDGVQNQLYSLNYNSPVSLSINLKITPYGKLELSKLNEDGKLINGSIFEITGPENYHKEIEVTNGKILLEKLKIGTYSVKEKTAPTGYLINTKEYNIEIKPGETTKLEVVNEKPTGTLIVNKTAVLRNNIDKSTLDNLDYSQIYFKLTAKEDIKDLLDEIIIYKKGDEVKIFNLSKDGKAEITNLPMGIYELQEIKTIDGLVLNNEQYEIKFEKKDSETKVYKETKNIENNTTEIQISKKDITGGDEELIGAKLTVIDENNKIIDSWTTTNVAHKIEGLVAGKTYILREESAPYGYSISEDIKFTVEDDNSVQKIEMKDAPILTKIQIEKLDEETKEYIKQKDFSFGIYEDEECTKIIKKVEANKINGTALFENLRYGTYFIKELKSPEGYSLSKNVVKLEINDKGVYADGKLLKENNGIYNFTFFNTRLPEVQTSDETNLGLLIILAIASCLIFGFIVVKMIKKNKAK